MIQTDAQVDLRLAEQDHRTANMLQLVASLLGRQAGRATDVFAADALRAADAQIRAFALLNQALHHPGIGVVCGTAYLRALCGHLHAACLAPRGLGLALLLPPSARMECRDAQAMGLLVVEAVTNAVKHAFPGERSGLVTISLAADPAEPHLQCTISDDGIGMKAAHTAPCGGRGVTFMRALAAGLGGSLLIGAADPGAWVSFSVQPCEAWADPLAATVPPALAAQHTTSSNLPEPHHGQA